MVTCYNGICLHPPPSIPCSCFVTVPAQLRNYRGECGFPSISRVANVSAYSQLASLTILWRESSTFRIASEEFGGRAGLGRVDLCLVLPPAPFPSLLFRFGTFPPSQDLWHRQRRARAGLPAAATDRDGRDSAPPCGVGRQRRSELSSSLMVIWQPSPTHREHQNCRVH